MCVDFTNLNKACPQDPFPLSHIDQIVDSTAECDLLCFLDAFSGLTSYQDGGGGRGENGLPNPVWSVLQYLHVVWVAQRRRDLPAIDAHRPGLTPREER